MPTANGAAAPHGKGKTKAKTKAKQGNGNNKNKRRKTNTAEPVGGAAAAPAEPAVPRWRKVSGRRSSQCTCCQEDGGNERCDFPDPKYTDKQDLRCERSVTKAVHCEFAIRDRPAPTRTRV